MQRFNILKNYAVLRNLCRVAAAGFHDANVKKNVLYGGYMRLSQEKRSLGRFLFDRLREPTRAERVIQVSAETGAAMTTQTFLKQSVAIAEGLRERNIQKGDYILVVGNNSLNMNVTLTGIFMLGAVAVPISYFANPDDLKSLLKVTQPKFFICDGQTLFTIRRIVTNVLGDMDEKRVFLLNDSKYLNTHLQCFPDFIEGKGERWETFKPGEVKNPKDEIALVMKSLTEGAGSKGVGLTHSNLMALISRYEVTRAEEMATEVILMVQKIIWMSGIFSLLSSCCFGSKLVVMSEFDEELFMKTMQNYKVTTCFLYPTKLWQLLKYKYPQSYNLTSCRRIFAVGGRIPKFLIDGMKEKTGLTVKPAYGITEMSGTVIEPSKDGVKEGSMGKLVPMCYAKVVSTTTNQNFGPNQPGELCFKGPTLMKGYVNDEKTGRDLIDKDGFLHSGDYGFYDEDGHFFILDKIKQVIRFKNNEISPQEIEGVLKSMDAIKDCVVSGIPHTRDGYHPVAFVVLQQGRTITAEEIKKFVESKLPEHKHLKGGVVFIPKVPRSRESGFIKRGAINKVLAKYRLVTESEAESIPVKEEAKDAKAKESKPKEGAASKEILEAAPEADVTSPRSQQDGKELKK